MGAHAGVGTHHADLKSLGNPPDPVGVLGEEIPREADVGLVGKLLRGALSRHNQSPETTTHDDLVLPGETNEPRKRPKRLFGRHELGGQSAFRSLSRPEQSQLTQLVGTSDMIVGS